MDRTVLDARGLVIIDHERFGCEDQGDSGSLRLEVEALYSEGMGGDQFESFRRRFQERGTDPEEVVKLLVEAMTVLEVDADLGKQMMCVVLSKRELDETPGTLSGYSLRRMDQVADRLLRNPDIARSYAGGTHQNDYRDFDPSELRITLDKAYSPRGQGIDYPAPGQAKFFVASGGADRPRPVTLARNNAGYWKVTSYTSLSTGVRPPATAAGDF